jgi:hypothetical protein
MPAMRLFPLAIALLCSTAAASAQTVSPSGQSASTGQSGALRDYESCAFDDGLQIVKIDSLPPGVQERTIHTTHGPKTIQMLAGRRIMFAYGLGGDFFANVKPELLPSSSWDADKENLLDEIQAMLRADFNTRPSTSLPRAMHGIEVHGLDRTELKSGTLGFYILIDNPHHIATSVYLLNQEPLTRHFQTIEQYRDLRTRFLDRYTGCIAQNQTLQTPTNGGPDAK